MIILIMKANYKIEFQKQLTESQATTAPVVSCITVNQLLRAKQANRNKSIKYSHQ